MRSPAETVTLWGVSERSWRMEEASQATPPAGTGAVPPAPSGASMARWGG